MDVAVCDAFEDAWPDIVMDFDVFVCMFGFEFYDLGDSERGHDGWLDFGSRIPL